MMKVIKPTCQRSHRQELLFWPVAAMTASLAGAVSFMLFLIRDLDNPFQGDWHGSPALILAAADPIDM